jgi:hypothetical protein
MAAQSTNTENALRDVWRQTRERLAERHLLKTDGASLSLRWPASSTMWFGLATDTLPAPVAWTTLEPPDGPAALHATIYGLRADVGAIAGGGGFFGSHLANLGGSLQQLFDEQARHIGPMGIVVNEPGAIGRSAGRGNAILVHGVPFCLGTTATRMAQNAELFEKCTAAYVLAVAAGGTVKPLPWLVRWIANRRLKKEQRRAAERFAAGLLPEESRGY